MSNLVCGCRVTALTDLFQQCVHVEKVPDLGELAACEAIESELRNSHPPTGRPNALESPQVGARDREVHHDVVVVDNDVPQREKGQYKAPGDASVDVVSNAMEGCGSDCCGTYPKRLRGRTARRRKGGPGERKGRKSTTSLVWVRVCHRGLLEVQQM